MSRSGVVLVKMTHLLSGGELCSSCGEFCSRCGDAAADALASPAADDSGSSAAASAYACVSSSAESMPSKARLGRGLVLRILQNSCLRL